MTFEELQLSRTAAAYADFFLPFLSTSTHVLDLGCGDGTLSIGIAAVAGRVTAVDAAAEEFAEAVEYVGGHQIGNLTFVEADAHDLMFEDATFDACFCHSMLEAMPDPGAALQEVRRVLKPGGMLGVASTEYGGLILAGPHIDLLRRSNMIREELWLRWGSDPFLGRELRRLLGEAGFEDVEATTKAISYGTPARVRAFAHGRAEECRDEDYISEALSAGLSSASEMAEMAEAWVAWGESPASYAAFTWCRAVGRKPLRETAR